MSGGDLQKGDSSNGTTSGKKINRAQSFTELAFKAKINETENLKKSRSEEDFSELDKKDFESLRDADDFLKKEIRDDPNLRELRTKEEQSRRKYYSHIFQSEQCFSEAMHHFERLKEAISKHFQDTKEATSQQLSELQRQREVSSQQLSKLQRQHEGATSQQLSELQQQCDALLKKYTDAQNLKQLKDQLSKLDTSDAHLGTHKEMLTALEEYKGIFTNAQLQLKKIDSNYSAFDEQHLEDTMHTLRVCTDDIEKYSKYIEQDKTSKEVYEHVLSGETPKHELLEEYNLVRNMSNEDVEGEILDLDDNIALAEHKLLESRKEFSKQTSTIMDCLKPLQDKANTLMNNGGISKKRFREEKATKNSEIKQLQGSVSKTDHEIEQLQGSVSKTDHEIEQLQERVSKIETQESAFQRATEQDPQSSQDFQNLTPFIELTGSKDVRASLDKALLSYKAHKQHQFLESLERKKFKEIARQVEDRRHQLYMEVTPEKYPEQYKMSQDYRLRLNFQEVLTSEDSN